MIDQRNLLASRSIAGPSSVRVVAHAYPKTTIGRQLSSAADLPCPERESNPYFHNGNWILSPARLPVPPSGRVGCKGNSLCDIAKRKGHELCKKFQPQPQVQSGVEEQGPGRHALPRVNGLSTLRVRAPESLLLSAETALSPCTCGARGDRQNPAPAPRRPKEGSIQVSP